MTTPVRGHRKNGIETHHSTILEERDRGAAEGIPVTAVPRTLLDLASRRREWLLDEAVERAERLGLLRISEIDDLLDRSGRHRGRTKLAGAVAIYRPTISSRAKSERLFLAMVREAGLPIPAINIFVAGHEVDAYWEAERFAVEVDGWETHGTRKAFEEDPLRIENLKLAGIDAIRITARRIEREPKAVAKRLADLLAMQQAAPVRTPPAQFRS